MRLNPSATVWTETVGDFPILFIDDVYEDVDEVRRQALAADYSIAAAYYPGLHAPLDGHAPTRAVVDKLCGLLNAMGSVDYSPDGVRVDFSVITTPPEKLLAQQQHPHIDPVPLFALVYLSPGIETSTCFYRNRELGIHKIVTADDNAKYQTFMSAHATERLQGDYDVSASPYWEKLHEIEGRYNRLVCYPGNVFHSVMPGPVPTPFDIGKARITQRFAFGRVAARGDQPA